MPVAQKFQTLAGTVLSTLETARVWFLAETRHWDSVNPKAGSLMSLSTCVQTQTVSCHPQRKDKKRKGKERTEQRRKEKFGLFGDHDRSLSQQQPRAMTIDPSPSCKP